MRVLSLAPRLFSWIKKSVFDDNIFESETFKTAGPNEFFFWNAEKAAFEILFNEELLTVVTDKSLETTPNEAPLIEVL